MTDVNHIKVHQRGGGFRADNQAICRTKGAGYEVALGGGRLWNAGSLGVMAGTVADCTQAEALIDGIEAEYLLAALGYDINRVLAAARECGMVPQPHDKALFRARHLVENCFEHLKERAQYATHYANKAP